MPEVLNPLNFPQQVKPSFFIHTSQCCTNCIFFSTSYQSLYLDAKYKMKENKILTGLHSNSGSFAYWLKNVKTFTFIGFLIYKHNT